MSKCKKICHFVGLSVLVIGLFATPGRTQDMPPKTQSLTLPSYCGIVLAMWQRSNTDLVVKIALIDSLYQMPEEFLAQEQVVNEEFLVWRDAMLAEYGCDINGHMQFGNANAKLIDEYLQNSDMSARADSLHQVHDELYLQYQERRNAYNID